MSRWLWKVSKAGDSSSSVPVSHLPHRKKAFLTFIRNIPCFNLCTLPLGLPVGTTCFWSSLLPAFRFSHTGFHLCSPSLNSLQQLHLSLAVRSPKLGTSRGLTCALWRGRKTSLNLLATLGLTAAQGTASYPYWKDTALGHIQIRAHQNSLIPFLKSTSPAGEFPPCTGA